MMQQTHGGGERNAGDGTARAAVQRGATLGPTPVARMSSPGATNAAPAALLRRLRHLRGVLLRAREFSGLLIGGFPTAQTGAISSNDLDNGGKVWAVTLAPG